MGRLGRYACEKIDQCHVTYNCLRTAHHDLAFVANIQAIFIHAEERK
jgi:hypothetical protein